MKKEATIPSDEELEEMLLRIRHRFSELTENDCQRRMFLNRLRSLGRFDAEPQDYLEPTEPFLLKQVEIAYAVCHPECGNEAFIVVEAGPNRCDRCGETMYPVKFGSYRLKRK